MEQLILRSQDYPKKGSNEWILSDDTIEFCVIGKEKKNSSHARSDVTATELFFEKHKKRLDIYVDVGKKHKLYQVLWFAPESTDVAQQMHTLLGTEAQTRLDESNQRYEERIKRNKEAVKRNDQGVKRNDQISAVLDVLGCLIERDVFSEQELQEIASLKRYGMEIMNQLAELAEKDTGLTEQSTKLMHQEGSLIKSGVRKDDSRMIEVVTQSDDLERQIVANAEQIAILDTKNITQLEELTKWLELGQQRTK